MRSRREQLHGLHLVARAVNVTIYQHARGWMKQLFLQAGGAPQADGGDVGAGGGDASGEGQQWAYVPSTTVSAEITVEPVDAAGACVTQMTMRCAVSECAIFTHLPLGILHRICHAQSCCHVHTASEPTHAYTGAH